MRCGYNSFGEKKIYNGRFSKPSIGVLKVYSDSNDSEKVESVMDYLLGEKEISLPERAGFVILEDDICGTFTWKDKDMNKDAYLITKQDIQQINIPMNSELVKKIIKHEKEGWNIYLQNKNKSNFERYIEDEYGDYDLE